ncbi:TPA: hypothetical protein U2R15_004175 [Klebsiella aerogenes]|nr:hypothetical protein [Klebsiella aerogenes]
MCRHQDGRWEHRVDTDGNLDIAVTALDKQHHIYLGGSPGRLQMIKVDGVGNGIPLAAVKDQPDVRVATVSLGSDISEPVSTLGFYDPAGGGTLVMPVPNLLAVLLRSHTLTLGIPREKGKPLALTVDVSDIPVGAGHRCGQEEGGAGQDAVRAAPRDTTLPVQPAQVRPAPAHKTDTGPTGSRAQR